MSLSRHVHPVLSCDSAREFEAKVLREEAAEWAAMKRAGAGIARGLVQDFAELRPVPEHLRILVLIGKGNNGGDALIACGQLLADFPRARVDLILTSPAESLRPLAARALRQLEGRVQPHLINETSDSVAITQVLHAASDGIGYHICIDGLLGTSFQPPLRAPMAAVIEAVNHYEAIDLRAAVDLPSGRGDRSESKLSFDADFTYATGIVKRPVYAGIADCGRVRYINLGFFDGPQAEGVATRESVLLESVLDPLRRLRPASTEKRNFGHLFILGGSAFMPGALLMSVLAAVRSGVGLVTAFAPASVASSLAARVPEAMWIPWPETASGGLSPRAMPLLLDRVKQASAVLVGPGMGRDRQSELLVQDLVQRVEVPLVLDADALRTRVVEVAKKRRQHFGRVVLTPHMGEFLRMAKLTKPDNSSEILLDFCASYGVTTLLKGPNTRVCDGESVIFSSRGGPVLSRGGSGDILSGLIASMVAQNSSCVSTGVARGLMLQGLAAERLARAQGQVAVYTTQLLDYLPEVLRA